MYSESRSTHSSLSELGFSSTLTLEPRGKSRPTLASMAISPSFWGRRPSTSSSWETLSGMLMTRRAFVVPASVTSLK